MYKQKMSVKMRRITPTEYIAYLNSYAPCFWLPEVNCSGISRNRIFHTENHPDKMRKIPMALRILAPTSVKHTFQKSEEFKMYHKNISKTFERIFFARHRLWQAYLDTQNCPI